MVKYQVLKSNGSRGGGHFEPEHTVFKHFWPGRPNSSCDEILYEIEPNSWYLLFKSHKPQYQYYGDEDSPFDANSYALKITPSEALKWFAKQAIDAPNDLKELAEKNSNGLPSNEQADSVPSNHEKSMSDNKTPKILNNNKLDTTKINTNSDKCYGVILEDGIKIIYKGGKPTSIHLEKRLIRILEYAQKDSYRKSILRLDEIDDINEKQHMLKEVTDKHGIFLQFTHDLIKSALDKPDRNNEANRQDISKIRKSVCFNDEVGLISEFHKEEQMWKTTIPFKVSSSSDTDLPISVKTLQYREKDKRNIPEE